MHRSPPIHTYYKEDEFSHRAGMTKILPELYEENNEIPNVYNNILDTKIKSDVTNFRLKRSQINKDKRPF